MCAIVLFGKQRRTNNTLTDRSPPFPAGRDLIGVQNLMKKHQALQAELVGHEARINAVCEQGSEMVTEEHFASDVIQQKITALQERWNLLRVRLTLFPSSKLHFRFRCFNIHIARNVHNTFRNLSTMDLVRGRPYFSTFSKAHTEYSFL